MRQAWYIRGILINTTGWWRRGCSLLGASWRRKASATNERRSRLWQAHLANRARLIIRPRRTDDLQAIRSRVHTHRRTLTQLAHASSETSCGTAKTLARPRVFACTYGYVWVYDIRSTLIAHSLCRWAGPYHVTLTGTSAALRRLWLTVRWRQLE